MCDLELGSPSTASRVTTLCRSQRTKLWETPINNTRPFCSCHLLWVKVKGVQAGTFGGYLWSTVTLRVLIKSWYPGNLEVTMEKTCQSYSSMMASISRASCCRAAPNWKNVDFSSCTHTERAQRLYQRNCSFKKTWQFVHPMADVPMANPTQPPLEEDTSHKCGCGLCLTF